MKNKIKEWLKENAEQVQSELDTNDKIWVTKSRGDYITIVGMEYEKSALRAIMERGITQWVQSSWEAGKPINIGFNPEEQKWYGWSHRAIFGFGIGATCRKGDCHYRPVDRDDFLDDMVRFWSEDAHESIHAEHREGGVYVEWTYAHAPELVPNKNIRGHISGIMNPYPDEYGKGEWVAKTLADARQMAIDFANDVA